MNHTAILVAIVITVVLGYWGFTNLKKEVDDSAPIVHWKGEKPESVSILDILRNRPPVSSVFNSSLDGKKWYIGVTVHELNGNIVFSTDRKQKYYYQQWIENMSKINLPSQFHASFDVVTDYNPGTNGIPLDLNGLISQDNSL